MVDLVFALPQRPSQIDLVPSVGPTLAPPFLDSTKFLCDRVLSRKLQPLIENFVQDFNLVGVVMSRVTLIYKK